MSDLPELTRIRDVTLNSYEIYTNLSETARDDYSRDLYARWAKEELETVEIYNKKIEELKGNC